MVSKEQMDRIIQVILSDDKLFHYVMRLINQRVNTADCLQDPDWCVQVIDITIAKVFQEVKVVELVRRVLAEQQRAQNTVGESRSSGQNNNSTNRRKKAQDKAVVEEALPAPSSSSNNNNSSSPNGRGSKRNSSTSRSNTTQPVKNSPEEDPRRSQSRVVEKEDVVRTTSLSPSENHPDNDVSFVDPRRVVKQMNKFRAPPDAAKANMLSIEIEDDSDYSGPEHGRNLSSNDIHVEDDAEKADDDSDASTVQVVISPNHANANSKLPNKAAATFSRHEDEESISSKGEEHPIDAHEDEMDELFIMPSTAADKASTAKPRYEDGNSSSGGRKSPGKPTPVAAKSASREDVAAFSDEEPEPVERPIARDTKKLSDDEKVEEDDILDDDEDVKAWERKVLANMKDDESQDFSVEEDIPDDEDEDFAGDLDTRKHDRQEASFTMAEEDSDGEDFKHHFRASEEHDEPLRASRDSLGLDMGDIDEVAKPFEQTQQRSVESFHSLKSYSGDLDEKYDTGNSMASPNKPLYFDQSNFDAEADAAVTGKPVKKVRFDYELVKDIFFRDKTLPSDKGQMYYSHEEESQFCRDQNRECIKADTLGMSWMEYMNSRSDEEVVEDEYGDEHYDEYDEFEEGGELDQDFGHEYEHYYHDEDQEVLQYTTTAGDRIVFTDDLPEQEDSSDNF